MKKYFIQNSPFVVPTADGKLIEEHHGLATTNNSEISIAHMVAPSKWSEPFQTRSLMSILISFQARSSLSLMEKQ